MKTNPNRIPRSQADVDKALQIGRLEGVEFAITTLLWVLHDKHDCPAEDVKVLHDELEYLWDCLAHGTKYITFADIKKELKDEYDWQFHWTDGKIKM